MSLFVILGLLVCIEAQGTSAVTTVLVKKGDDLILNVGADVPEKFIFVEWNFNKTAILVRFEPGREPIIFPEFTGRVEVLGKTFSVKLKNLQDADSGVYTARVAAFVVNKLAEYKVTVQDSEGSSAGTSVYPVKIVVFSVGLIIMVSAVITVHLMEKFKKHK